MQFLQHILEPARLPLSKRRSTSLRSGKVLVMLAIMLPTLIAIVGLVLDTGLMMDEHRGLQTATDAAATAAATDLRLGRSSSVATATATDFVKNANGFSDATVTVNIPPSSGSHSGQANHVEVIAQRNYQSTYMQVMNGVINHTMKCRSVSGVEDATAGAAIVVLDPNPADLSLSGLTTLLGGINVNSLTIAALPQTGVAAYLNPIPIVGPIVAGLLNTSLTGVLPGQITGLTSSILSSVTLPPLPTLTAGLEVEGVGKLIVDGSIFVNNSWGGMDENGKLAGSAAGPPYAVACMPILATTRVQARNIRVVGGVDNKTYYGPFVSGAKGTLQASRLPVPDPFASVAVPSTASAGAVVTPAVQSPSHCIRVALPTTVVNTLTSDVLGALSALLKPLFSPLIAPVTTLLTQPTLQPGVYDSITVISPLGGATLSPGVYIIRNKSPLTQMSLCLLGPVQANGVMFYITDSSSFSASTGQPDASDNSSNAPANPVTALLPSTLIVPFLSTANISGLSASGSPFDGMLVYQRRLDRRPIVIEALQLLGTRQISGTIYSKWGHVIFLGGNASYDLRFVCGTMRVLTVTNTKIAPTNLLPAAQDVFLLE